MRQRSEVLAIRPTACAPQQRDHRSGWTGRQAARASGREAKPWTGKARQSMRKTKRKIGERVVKPCKASLSPRIFKGAGVLPPSMGVGGGSKIEDEGWK